MLPTVHYLEVKYITSFSSCPLTGLLPSTFRNVGPSDVVNASTRWLCQEASLVLVPSFYHSACTELKPHPPPLLQCPCPMQLEDIMRSTFMDGKANRPKIANMLLTMVIASSPSRRSASREKIRPRCERILIITTAWGSQCRTGTKRIVSRGATRSLTVCCWSSKGFLAGIRWIVMCIKKERDRDLRSACVKYGAVVTSSELAFAWCGIHWSLIELAFRQKIFS